MSWLNAISCYLNLVDFLKLGLISFIKCCPPSIFMLGGDFNFLLSLLAKKFESLNYQHIKHCLWQPADRKKNGNIPLLHPFSYPSGNLYQVLIVDLNSNSIAVLSRTQVQQWWGVIIFIQRGIGSEWVVAHHHLSLGIRKHFVFVVVVRIGLVWLLQNYLNVRKIEKKVGCDNKRKKRGNA